MAKLIVVRGEDKGQIFVLDKPAVSIGRDPANDVVLNDSRVSRKHARVLQEGEEFIFEDLGSVNGSFVNGTAVERHHLRIGDELKLGSTVMTFLLKGATQETDYKEDTDQVKIVPSLDDASGMTVEMKLNPAEVQPLGEELPPEGKGVQEKAYRRLNTLYRVAHELGTVVKISELMDHILKLVLDIMQADRCFILIMDDETGDLVPRFMRKRSGLDDSEKITVSQTIIEHVLKTGESILTSDAKQDERFKEAESIITHGIRSTMCVPLKAKQATLGIIHVDTKDRVVGFTKDDLELLTAICNQASIAIENAKLFENLRKANKELFEQQTQLVEAAKLSAIGLMASGMVHEIKNPLQGIMMCSEMTTELLEKKELTPDEVAQCAEYVQIMDAKIKHCSNLIQNLLQFARRKEMKKVPVQVNQAIEAALIIAQFHMMKNKVEIKKEFDPTLPLVLADDSQLQQVFLNMVINAMDAMEKGGTLTITSAKQGENEVMVSFTDTGTGIPADKIEEIFKPLYTSKEEGKGTGLGLSICKEIIEGHNGRIEVESTLGKGTTFQIIFPVCKEKQTNV